MTQDEFDEKIKYAQNIITILQTRLNDSTAVNVQLEATIKQMKEKYEKPEQEPVDGDSNKTKKK